MPPTTDAATPSRSLPGLAEQTRLLGGGETTSAELVDRALARIEATQPTINAFRVVCADHARADAARADERLATGERGPLLGVPVAIKDDMDLAGHPTAFGCEGEFELKQEDSEVARRLREAGAVIVGKTNSSELGQYPVTEGAAYGATRNPWSLDHTPGGSSGGTAAAVAAGIVAAAIGSDGAGSVRIPASWTGLVGIKPQRGRVSTWPDPDAFNGLTCNGPLARSVSDAAVLLDAISGNHDGDIHRPPAPREPFAEAAHREPRKLRIALSLKAPFSGAPVKLDDEARASTERIADELRKLGHDVVRADPQYRLMGLSFMPRSLSGVHAWVGRVPDASLLDKRTHENAHTGRLLGGKLLLAARRWESRLHRRVGSIFNEADVVLTPTTAAPPFRVGSIDGLSGWATGQLVAGSCPYAWAWNVLGWPGMSVPAGHNREGLPLGAQLLGRPKDEATLISLAAQLEQVELWHERVAPHAVAA